MDSDRLPRRLAAILYADVADYSRLTGDDEDATHRALREQLDHISETIRRYHGRVVHYAGDAVLAEFNAVVNALSCAARIQQEFGLRNRDVAVERKVQFRIGVNLGDVIDDRGDIYGDGVNVAARLESLAQPGAICISESVRNAVGNRLPLEYEFAGEQQVKNIAEPVRAYRVGVAHDAELPVLGSSARPGTPHRRTLGVAGVLALLVAAGLLAWLEPWAPQEPPVAAADGRPTIAVLPFANMSGNPQQEYFVDGITEDLITDLSKISGLLVVSRNAAFRYKGKNVAPEEVGEELDVRYVLEGSVRRSADRLRVTAQLINTDDGYHIWAERYDRDLTDVFEVQDEITGKIVSALDLTLSQGEERLLEKKITLDSEAYDYLLRARAAYVRWTPESNEETVRLLRVAIELDPAFAQAYAELAYAYFQRWILEGSRNPETLGQALELAQQAVDADASLPQAHTMLGWMHLWRKEHDRAIAAMERAIDIDPNYAEGMARLCEALVFAGQPKKGLRYIQMARERTYLEPYFYGFWAGEAYYYVDRHDEALRELQGVVERHASFFPARRFLAAVYAELGRMEEARAEVEEVLRLNPNVSIGLLRRQLPFKRQEDLERQLDALRRAGLPA